MSWIVLVTEQRNGVLTSASAVSYQSPPHCESDAWRLVELLRDGARPTDSGPWRHAIPGGQRTIDLRPA